MPNPFQYNAYQGLSELKRLKMSTTIFTQLQGTPNLFLHAILAASKRLRVILA